MLRLAAPELRIGTGQLVDSRAMFPLKEVVVIQGSDGHSMWGSGSLSKYTAATVRRKRSPHGLETL